MADIMRVSRPGAIPAFMVRFVMGRRIYETVKMNCRVTNKKAKTMLGWSLRYPCYRQGLPAAIAAIEGAVDGANKE
jgi:hypothetical protein